jgi:chemotaxis-related protein WspD
MTQEREIRELFQNVQNRKGLVSANVLLERISDQSYLEEWTDLLAQGMNPKDTSESSAVLFRMGSEWLALSTFVFRQVADKRQIHQIPHRQNPILLGLVNLQGQLTLCVALNRMLEIDCPEINNKPVRELIESRFIAISKDNETWVFPVSEIFGVFHYDLSKVENVPVTVAKSTANYLKGVINWNNKNVGLIDDDLIFYSLKRCLQ